jgi:polyisoprenoid-binding protein YceI
VILFSEKISCDKRPRAKGENVFPSSWLQHLKTFALPLLIGLLSLGYLSVASASAAPEFPEGQSCAAWKTKKRMFLVRSVEPVGISCELKVERNFNESHPPQLQSLRISVPVASLNSGEAERDAEVVKLLKGESFPHIVIATEKLEPSAVEQFHKGEKLQVRGRIEVGGQSIERNFSVQKDSQGFARVSLEARFKDFGIQAPRVAGGVVAQVQDQLELHAQIQISEMVPK